MSPGREFLYRILVSRPKKNKLQMYENEGDDGNIIDSLNKYI